MAPLVDKHVLIFSFFHSIFNSGHRFCPKYILSCSDISYWLSVVIFLEGFLLQNHIMLNAKRIYLPFLIRHLNGSFFNGSLV